MEVGLSEEVYESQEEYRRMISHCIRYCNSGNRGTRETVLDLIDEYLVKKLHIVRDEWILLIPFHEPRKMTVWQQLEALIFYLDKDNLGNGFEKLCEMSDWRKKGGIISKEEILQAYYEVAPCFSIEEERKVLAQLLYAETVGLGIVDTLNNQKGYIEEIQIGMSGHAEQQFDYAETLSEKREKNFSKDGLHVMVRGTTIWLKDLSFETEEELQRVLRNFVRETGGELTQNRPMLVADTPDGRRISISRPPMTETWVGLIRKFDTVPVVSLEQLYSGYPEGDILPKLLKQLVRSGKNIAFTGEMASGKTTLFRACLAEIKRDMNIRLIESDSFELNVRGFLPQANSLTMRITEKTPTDDVLAFARKTTGQIFAIGEINSAAMAAMAMDLSKIASQLLFSAHYITTEHMIADFVNAKLCVGGYSEERLAELDVVRCLEFDVHLKVRQGQRRVQWINEIIPIVKEKNQSCNMSTYEIRRIYQYDEDKEQGVLINSPSKYTYDRAKQLLEKEEYLEFVRFFEG